VKRHLRIGDVIAGPMLAHKAEDEGMRRPKSWPARRGPCHLRRDPSVITPGRKWPRSANPEEEAKAAHRLIKSANSPSWPIAAPARRRKRGFVKIIADAHLTGVLGVHILGPMPGTLIAEAVLAMNTGVIEDIARTCHAHPTLNEAVQERRLAVLGRAVHV